MSFFILCYSLLTFLKETKTYHANRYTQVLSILWNNLILLQDWCVGFSPVLIFTITYWNSYESISWETVFSGEKIAAQIADTKQFPDRRYYRPVYPSWTVFNHFLTAEILFMLWIRICSWWVCSEVKCKDYSNDRVFTKETVFERKWGFIKYYPPPPLSISDFIFDFLAFRKLGVYLNLMQNRILKRESSVTTMNCRIVNL